MKALNLHLLWITHENLALLAGISLLLQYCMKGMNINTSSNTHLRGIFLYVRIWNTNDIADCNKFNIIKRGLCIVAYDLPCLEKCYIIIWKVMFIFQCLTLCIPTGRVGQWIFIPSPFPDIPFYQNFLILYMKDQPHSAPFV